MDDNDINKKSSIFENSFRKYTRSAPTSVALEPIVVFGSSRVSTASSYKSAKSMTDSMKQSKKFPKLSTITSLSHSHSTNTYQSKQQKTSNLIPPPLSSILAPNKAVTTSSSLTSPSYSHRSYTPSSQYTSESKLPLHPQPPPIQQQQQIPQYQQQTPPFQHHHHQQQQQFQPQYPYNPYQPIQPSQQQQQQQQLYPPYYYNYPPVPPPLQQQYPFQSPPIYYPPPLQNNSTIGVPQSEVPDKIVYREVQEEKPLSPRQYFIYRNGCALKVMKWYRKQKQIRREKEKMKEAEDISVDSQNNEINPHTYNEMIIRQADQYLLDQQTRKNRSLLGELTKEIYEEDLNDALRNIIIETIHDEVTEYFNRRDVVYNKRITDPAIFDIDPKGIEIRSLIREGIIDRLISHGLLNKLSRDTNLEDNFYDLP